VRPLPTAFGALAAIVVPTLAAAQQGALTYTLPEKVHLDDVHPGVGGERVVDLYVRMVTRYDEPIEQIKKVDIDVHDADGKIQHEDLSLEQVGDTTRGITCVLVIDASPTMRGETFERAKQAAREFLERLGAYDKVALVAFGAEARLVSAFDAPKVDASRRLEDLEAETSPAPTVLYDGLHLAIDEIRKSQNLPRRTFVIVFSDGKDGGSSKSLDEVLQFADGGESRTHILLYAIGFDRFGGEGLSTLRAMADATGGEFFEATSVENLNPFFTDVWRQVNRSYVIRFPGKMDGKSHTVTVAVGGKLGTKTVLYPDMPWPLWYYLAPVGVLLVLVLSALVVKLTRSPGRLVWVAGPDVGDVYRLRRGTTRIGGLDDNDVVIREPSVSRNHAEIHVRGRRVEIQDLHSKNGTWVNGSRVRSSPLQVGDKVRLGAVELVFER
jgi:VWFA-related protein